MLQDPLAETWERIPSLDGLTAALAESLEGLNSLYLGPGSDGVPIFAFSPQDSDGPRALLIAGGSGDGVACLSSAVSLLAQGGLPGYRTWVIAGLDASRLRHNDSQLGSLSPSLKEHVLARRSPWGPGEDPEQSLPVDSAPLLQPDRIPDGVDGVECSPEALALARALSHLSPELVISLRESPGGGLQLSASQPLFDEDWEALCEPLLAFEVPLNAGPRSIPGHSVAEHQGCIVLHSLSEESKRLDGEKVAIGPVGTWQLMQALAPDSLYLSLTLPRFSSPDIGNSSPSGQARTVKVVCEPRLIKGREQLVRVEVLERPGHPADQAEVRIEKTDESDQSGLLEDQPAKSGWLAVEAMLERQALLTDALRLWQDSLEHMEGEDSQRGMQVLLAAGELEAKLRSAQSNKRQGDLATMADWVYWDQVYRYETCLLLSESLRCLRLESQTDPKITDLRSRLEEMIDAQLEQVELTALDAQAIAQIAADWSSSAVSVISGGGAAIKRAEIILEQSEKALFEARRAQRSAKQLKLPPAERKEAEEALEEAERDLLHAKKHLETLKGGVAAIEGDPSPDAVLPDLPDQEAGEVSPPGPPDLPDPPVDEPEDMSLYSSSGEEAAQGAEAPVVEAPELPSVDASDPDTWFIGPDRGRVDLDPQLDIEPMLPRRLEIPPEWGREPIHWKDQIPKRNQQPMLRRLARHLAAQPPVEPEAAEAEVEDPGLGIEPSESQVVAATEARSTGWVRRRAELSGRYSAPSPNLPEVDSKDGRWRDFRRGVN